jgi:glycosyltransferase involved in cell wall biosynthesis
MKIFIICSGLEKIRRGFESFTEECFEALSEEKSLDIILFKGSGKAQEKSVPLWHLSRDSWMAIQLGKLLNRGPYFIEQISFALNLLPHIRRHRPDVIYFSDGAVGNFLWHWRNLTKQKYQLLLSNGAPSYPPFMPYCDHIQQVVPSHLQAALDGGIPIGKQSLVPYGIKVPSQLKVLSLPDREVLKWQLGLPKTRALVLSVGAINKSHKRMDYLIREVARLPDPKPYLLLLGQQDGESPQVVALAEQLLGEENFQIRTVALEEVKNYYQAADVFVLASLAEGFGRVFIEAMAYGLPCLAHDYEITRFVLSEEGYLANFELDGSLTSLLQQFFAADQDENKRYIRHRSAYKHFSWDKLRPMYVELIERVCAQVNETV